MSRKAEKKHIQTMQKANKKPTKATNLIGSVLLYRVAIGIKV